MDRSGHELAGDLRGIWAAMPLPWNRDDTLDTGLLGELVARYRAAGVHGAYALGTDGEFHVLEFDEYRIVVDAFVQAADGAGLPIQVGASWLTARGALERAAYARAQGIRCVQIAPPFWVPLNPSERARFFGDLAARLPDVAVLLYNTERIGRLLGPEDFRALAAAAPTLVGSKYDGFDRAQFAAICAATPALRHFVVDVGVGPSAAYPTVGMCSWMVNLNPTWTMAWWGAIERGDWAEADRRTALALGFIHDWERLWGRLTASAALAKLTARCGIAPEMPLRVRAPYLAGTDEDVAVLRRLLETRYPELISLP